MGSWRRKWTIIGTLSLIFQCFEPLVGDHTALTLNSQIAYRFQPVPGKAFFGPRDPLNDHLLYKPTTDEVRLYYSTVYDGPQLSVTANTKVQGKTNFTDNAKLHKQTWTK